jgi:hypothetical protein
MIILLDRWERESIYLIFEALLSITKYEKCIRLIFLKTVS